MRIIESRIFFEKSYLLEEVGQGNAAGNTYDIPRLSKNLAVHGIA